MDVRHRQALDKLRDIEADEEVDNHEGRLEATMSLLEESVQIERPLAETIKLARKLDGSFRQKERKQERDHHDAMVKWRAEHSGDALQLLRLFSEPPSSLASLRMDVVPPVLGMDIINFRDASSAEFACGFSKWLKKNGNHPGSLGPALDDSMKHYCRLLSESDDMKKYVKDFTKKKVQPSRCWLEGICVCFRSPNGQRLWTFRNMVLRAVKAWCRPGSAERSLLAESRIFLQFVPTIVAESAEDGDNNLCMLCGVAARVYHVSESLFSPWKLTLMECYTDLNDHEVHLCQSGEGEIPLKARCVILSYGIHRFATWGER